MRIGWIFEDPVESTTLVMEVNPNSGASPDFKKTITKKVTTAPGGRVLLFEGNDPPQQFDFSGVILTEGQYNFLYNAWSKRHLLRITDDLLRTFEVYFESFSPKRKVSATNRWRHDYSASTVIVRTVT